MGVNDDTRKEKEETKGVMKMEPTASPTKNPRRSNVLPERTSSPERTVIVAHPVSLHLHHNVRVTPNFAAGKFVPPVPRR